MPVDEFDWLFDYVLQFLESDKFDAAVMDFVDEKCEVFDNDDENKFIYTDIHHEFRDHLEILITSNLSALQITMDMFLDAMEKGQNNRDINKLVFERLTAMDDFLIFKRMMVKRNIELQVEALRSYQSIKLHDDEEYDNDDDNGYDSKHQELEDESLPDPDELRMMKERELDDIEANDDELDDEEIQELLHASLMEMELLRHREELEQADLEAALVLSLSLEEERIRLLRVEAKNESDATTHADAKDSSRTNHDHTSSASKAYASSKDADPYDDVDSKTLSSSSSSVSRSAHVKPLLHVNNLPDPKPLRLTKDPLKPLPSISKLSAELEDRKNKAEELLRSSADHFAKSRQHEQELRSQIYSTKASSSSSSSNKLTDEQYEIEKRAKHMREQRDKILAMKKAEREKKVVEEEKRSKAQQPPLSPSKGGNTLSSSYSDAKGSSNVAVLVTDDNAIQRGALSEALARRLKMDLLVSEEQKLAKQHGEQFADLDRQLLQVEKLRHDNHQRELILTEQLKRQQYVIAKNVKASASALRDDV